MAFRTNLMPTLQEKSASGSVATFNTALAMPLVECKTEFMATQSGEGTPSPTNPRSIVGVSSLDVVVNGSTISKSLGDTYYEGTLDLLNGLLTITPNHRLVDMSTLSFTYVTSDQVPYFRTPISPTATGYNGDNLCSCYEKSPVNNLNTLPNLSYVLRSNNFNIRDDSYTDATAFTNSLSGQYLYYELSTPDTPITYQLTPEQIATIIGDNTISTTGNNLDIKYKDLDIAKRGNFREVFKLPS